MKITQKEIERHLGLLSSSLDRIASHTQNLGEDQLHYRTREKEWSISEILAHLRSCSDVWGNTVEAMLTEENPLLPDIHPRQWLKRTNYLHLQFAESFQALTNQRAHLLSVLKQLTLEDWSRSATIGRRKHTVFSQVRRMAKHEAGHVTQIESMLPT
jgi:hypothetical protein